MTTAWSQAPPSRFAGSKMPDRPLASLGAFNGSTTAAPAPGGHNARQEREREKAERERMEREELEQLTVEQQSEIRECFGLFDLDKDGFIDYHEFKVSLKALGFDLHKQEVLTLLQTHGSPSSSSTQQGPNARSSSTSAANPSKDSASNNPHIPALPPRYFLSFTQFQRIVTSKILSRDPKEEIMRAFRLFNPSGTGAITVDDLAKVAADLGEPLHEDEVRAMIDEFDLTGDGTINEAEFMAICLNE